MKYSIILASLAMAYALPANAQERGVSRRTFAFLDNDVTVEVSTDVPGTLQIVRGQPGTIEAAGRVPGGLSTFALGGREGDKLRVTAVGGDRADFIVVVPEETYVRVVLPNHRGGSLGATRSAGNYTWGGVAMKTAPTTFAGAPAIPTIAYSASRAPRELSIPQLTAVRTIHVRMDASSFEVAGNHYMTVANGSSDNVEIRPGIEAEDLTISIPAYTRDFTLRLAGKTALVVRDLAAMTYCEPVTEQSLGDGAHWFTFSPEMGRLTCR